MCILQFYQYFNLFLQFQLSFLPSKVSLQLFNPSFQYILNVHLA